MIKYRLTVINFYKTISLGYLQRPYPGSCGAEKSIAFLSDEQRIQDGYFALVALFLPEFILQHYKLKVEVRKEQYVWHLELEE